MSQHDVNTKHGPATQTASPSANAAPSAAPGKSTLTSRLAEETVAPVQMRADRSATPHETRSNAEDLQSVVVRPSLAPFTPPQRSDAPAGGRAAAPAGPASRTSHEGLPPEQTDTEKRNYMASSTPVSRDLAPGGSSGLTTINLSDVEIRGEVHEDHGQWQIRVTAASTRIHWGINTGGYQVPNPVDGGNITQANYQSVITELAGYQARQASGSWHDPHASEVHELNHVAWFQGEITRTWTAIETAITAHSLGATASVDRAAAETAMNTYLNTKRRDWFNAYGVAPEPPAYAAGQAVLDGIIARIRAYATSKGWTGGGSGSGGGSGGSGSGHP